MRAAHASPSSKNSNTSCHHREKELPESGASWPYRQDLKSEVMKTHPYCCLGRFLIVSLAYSWFDVIVEAGRLFCSVCTVQSEQESDLHCRLSLWSRARAWREGGREGGGGGSERKNAFLAMLQKDTVPRTLVVMVGPLYCVIIKLISGLCVCMCVLTETISSSYQRQERKGWTVQSKLHIVIVPAGFFKDWKVFSKQEHIFCLFIYLSIYQFFLPMLVHVSEVFGVCVWTWLVM